MHLDLGRAITRFVKRTKVIYKQILIYMFDQITSNSNWTHGKDVYALY